MAAGKLRKYWFCSLWLLHALYTFAILVMGMTYQVLNLVYKASLNLDASSVLQDLGLCLCLANTIYMLTYGYLYAETILGSFVVQQAVTLVIAALLTGSMGASWEVYPLALTAVCVQVFTSLVLCGLLLRERWRGDSGLGSLWVNVEDLATGAQPSIGSTLSWGGVRRHEGRVPRRGRVAQSIVNFVRNSVLRRVRPVETKLYVLVQHAFALACIVLLVTRTIVLLTQLGNDELPSRSRMMRREGVNSMQNDEWLGSIALLVRYPEYSNLRDPNDNSEATKDNTVFSISVALQTNSTSSILDSAKLCSATTIHTIPDPNRGNSTDWFGLHRCGRSNPIGSPIRPKLEFVGFQYTLTTRVSPEDAEMSKLPDMWLVDGGGNPDLRAPYFVAPIQPVRDMHTVHMTHYATRRSISSSPFWDAITGSKPKFNELQLYPESRSYTRPMLRTNNSADTIPYASGFIFWPRYLSFSQTAQREVMAGYAGSDKLVEVIEEYRIGNSFDILASIGGLFALLQGFHLFLFGRPLFWGIFGAKLIAPFGFFGRFASRGFRQRLHDHYYPSGSQTTARTDRNGTYTDNNMHITQFLLDYVLDLGPASAKGLEARSQQADSDSMCARVELGEMNNSKDSMCQELDAGERDNKSFLPSTTKY